MNSPPDGGLNLDRGSPTEPIRRSQVARINVTEGIAKTQAAQASLDHRRALRWELRKCYRRAGVNHYTECRQIAHAYMKAIMPYVVVDYDV